MKKFLIIIILFALHQELSAQISTGAFVATGSFGYSQFNRSGKNDLKEITHSYHVSPRIGYMIADNLEAGLFGNLHKRTEDYDGRMLGAEREFSVSKTTEKAIGVYLRKYFFITDKVAFTGTGEASYKSHRSTREAYAEGMGFRRLQNDYLYKTSLFEASIRPGFSFFISEKIALNATYGALSYTFESLDNSDWQHYNSQAPQQNEYERKTHNLKLDFSSASSSFGVSYFF